MKKVLFLSMVLILAGSCAALFCQAPAIQAGDVNEDNAVDIIDALLVSQYYVGLNPVDLTNTAVADVDTSGDINIIDALLISQFYVGLIPELPVGNYDYSIIIDDTFTITLGTTPSTGYGWFYTIDDPNVLILESDIVHNCGDLAGSPCDHSFVFRGVSAGITIITLEYYRDFEDPPVIAQTITNTVQVN